MGASPSRPRRTSPEARDVAAMLDENEEEEEEDASAEEAESEEEEEGKEEDKNRQQTEGRISSPRSHSQGANVDGKNGDDNKSMSSSSTTISEASTSPTLSISKVDDFVKGAEYQVKDRVYATKGKLWEEMKLRQSFVFHRSLHFASPVLIPFFKLIFGCLNCCCRLVLVVGIRCWNSTDGRNFRPTQVHLRH